MAQRTASQPGKGHGSTAPGRGTRDVPVHHPALKAGRYRIPRNASTPRKRFLTAGNGPGHD
jgi:hypothetical protein